MCGIVGYVGSNSSTDVLLGGLRRLEYRGYDSAGIAVIDPAGDITSAKKAGKLQALVDELDAELIPMGGTGIGHTRWATHGGPTDENAHPHLADGGKLALIHNGIIENFSALRAELTAEGVEFLSETDSEVADTCRPLVPRPRPDHRHAAGRAAARRRVHAPRRARRPARRRRRRPAELAARGRSRRRRELHGLGRRRVRRVHAARAVDRPGRDRHDPPRRRRRHPLRRHPRDPERVRGELDASAADKGGWSSFMAKEISEEPEAVAKTILGRVHEGAVTLPTSTRSPTACSRSTVSSSSPVALRPTPACSASTPSSSGHASLEVELAHEFRYRDPVLNDRSSSRSAMRRWTRSWP